MTGHGARLMVQLLALVILGRLLTPEDFGLVAMVGLLVGVGELLRDFGLSAAALQARTLSHQQASNLFWANTALGATAALAMTAVAPAWAGLFGDGRLVGVAAALSLPLFINAAQLQLQVQLARELRFLALALTDFASQVAGLLAAVIVALAGGGYWALAAQLQVVAAVLFVTRLVLAQWRPSRPRRGAQTGKLFSAGGNLGAAQLLSFLAASVDNLVVGLRSGPVLLGQYDRAFRLHAIPTAGLVGPLTNVVIPILNRHREEGGSARRQLVRIQTLVGMGFVALYVIGAIVAEPLVRLALGSGWTTAGQLFAILCLGGAVQGLSTVNYWVYLHEGRSRDLLHSNLIAKTVGVILVVCASFRSVETVAWAYVAGLAFTWSFATWYMGRVGVFDTKPFYSAGAQVLAPAAVTYGVGSQAMGRWAPESDAAAVLVGALLSSGFLLAVYSAMPACRAELIASVRMVSRRLKRPEGRG